MAAIGYAFVGHCDCGQRPTCPLDLNRARHDPVWARRWRSTVASRARAVRTIRPSTWADRPGQRPGSRRRSRTALPTVPNGPSRATLRRSWAPAPRRPCRPTKSRRLAPPAPGRCGLVRFSPCSSARPCRAGSARSPPGCRSASSRPRRSADRPPWARSAESANPPWRCGPPPSCRPRRR